RPGVAPASTRRRRQVVGSVLAAVVALVVRDEYPIRHAWTFVIPPSRAEHPAQTRGEIDGRTGINDRGDADTGVRVRVGADLGPEGTAPDRERGSRPGT